MVWDFTETNPLAGAAGDIAGTAFSVYEILDKLVINYPGLVECADVGRPFLMDGVLISTDPPYYDNIEYADLSDFFYVWMRRMLRSHFPRNLATMLVPKAEELVATPYRHGGNVEAEEFLRVSLG
jgi:putative DNA methylase